MEILSFGNAYSDGRNSNYSYCDYSRIKLLFLKIPESESVGFILSNGKNGIPGCEAVDEGFGNSGLLTSSGGSVILVEADMVCPNALHGLSEDTGMYWPKSDSIS